MMRYKFVSKDWYAMNISRFVGESYNELVYFIWGCWIGKKGHRKRVGHVVHWICPSRRNIGVQCSRNSREIVTEGIRYAP